MIIEMLLDGIYNLMNTLLVFDIPALPEQVYSYVTSAFEYMVAGAGILANYTPLSYLLVLFGVLLAVDGGIMVYHLVMWIIKKIPVIGVQ